jgi:hypothetical protein
MAAIPSEEPLDTYGTSLGFARGVFVEDEVLGVVLVHGPPAERLGVLGAGKDFDAEVGVDGRGTHATVLQVWRSMTVT